MMKVLLFIGLVATFASASLLAEEEYETLFSAHLKKYNKQYSNEEMFQRFDIFKTNYDFILKHNMQYEQGHTSFTLGANQFADMTNAEYQKSMLNLKRGNTQAFASSTFSDNNVADLPKSFDWVSKGAVTPVKNQGQCGSCWAFSATAAMEGANFQKTGKLLSLSEQLCVDCVDGGADTCDMGGEMHDCYLQIIKEGGDMTEEDYPYTASSGGGCHFNKSKAVADIFTGYTNVTSGDENALLKATSEHVISVGIDASSIFFQLYSGGVYNVPSCMKKWDELDHGVTVTGWGVDNGDDYWVVKNSWGTMWGLSGYIWMSRNKDNQCGIATDATWPNTN